MNALTGLTCAVIYDSTKPFEIAGAAIIKEACPSVTVLDFAGDVEATMTNHIATLSATTYDKIFCLCQPQDTYSAAGRPTYDHIASLRGKLKTASLATTYVDSGTAQSGGNDYIQIAAAAASAVDDYYNGLFVVTTGGTGSGQTKFILDYDAAGGTPDEKVIVGGAAWGTNPDATTTYTISNETNLIIPQNAGLTTTGAYLVLSAAEQAKSTSRRVWEAVRTDGTTPNTVPMVIQYLNAADFTPHYGTSTAGSTTSLTDSGASFGTSGLENYYCYMNSGTGIRQYAKITSHTATALTLAYWQSYPLDTVSATGTSPSNDTVYRVVSNVEKIFWDLALSKIIPAKYYDITNVEMFAKWQRLLNNADDKSNLDNLAVNMAPEQDTDLLKDELINDGLAICAGIFTGVVS